jgi:hypothetical protein
MPVPRSRLAGLLACAALLGLPGAARADSARPADAFVDSVGVNVHLTYGDTAYGRFSLVRDRLTELGVRHIRDGLCGSCGWQLDSLDTLASRGIRSDLIVGWVDNRTGTLAANLAAVRSRLLGSVDMLESPNEWDNFSGWSSTWAPQLRAYQASFWNAVQADPQLRRIPVAGPSLVGWDSRAKLGNLSGELDLGNLHSYPGGKPPGSNLDYELDLARTVSGSKPVVATETGYHNALASNTGHPPVSEAAAAVYEPRLFLEDFRRGIVRTYSYELVDEWPGQSQTNQEASFGLVRSDFSRKPAFDALRNLLGILADPGAGQPVTADVPLTVTTKATDLHRLVLRKRDGRIDVVLWRAASVWNTTTRQPIAVDALPVTVGFPGAGRVQRFAPVESAAGTDVTPSGGGYTVAVGAAPIVLELTPAAAATAPVTATTAKPGTAPKLTAKARAAARTEARERALARAARRARAKARAEAAHAAR